MRRAGEGIGNPGENTAGEKIGGSAWESNPPAALLRRHTGFEERKQQFFQPLDIGPVFP